MSEKMPNPSPNRAGESMPPPAYTCCQDTHECRPPLTLTCQARQWHPPVGTQPLLFIAVNQLDSEQEITFLHTAKIRIPELMDTIDKGGPQRKEHSILMGYLMGYLCIISGHRSVVLTSMVKEHVANADQWSNGSFQVWVDEHKSVRTFGRASLVLNCEEFSWLRWLHDAKCCTAAQGTEYIFHTVQGLKIGKPTNCLHLAWGDAGLKGPVSFNAIRKKLLSLRKPGDDHRDEEQVSVETNDEVTSTSTI